MSTDYEANALITRPRTNYIELNLQLKMLIRKSSDNDWIAVFLIYQSLSACLISASY